MKARTQYLVLFGLLPAVVGASIGTAYAVSVPGPRPAAVRPGDCLTPRGAGWRPCRAADRDRYTVAFRVTSDSAPMLNAAQCGGPGWHLTRAVITENHARVMLCLRAAGAPLTG